MAKKSGKNKKKRKRENDTTSSAIDGQDIYGRCVNVSERYEKLGRIGAGTYGVVYKARDKQHNNKNNTSQQQQLVALKKCLPHNESTDGFPLTTLREIQSLRMCNNHDNIVHLRDIAVSTHGVFLVFDLCPHDLAQLIDYYYQQKKRSPFTQAQCKRLLFQLLSALDFMHSRCLIHRDIKVSNLLYSADGQLQLADFGLSRKMGPTLTPKVVSLWYRPPELLFGNEDYDMAVDIWGTGCVFGELLEGVPLLDGKNELDQCAKVFELLGPPTVSQWPELLDMPLVKNGTVEIPRPSTTPVRHDGKSLLDRFSYLSANGLTLLSSLLSYNPQMRGSAAQALRSEYFAEVPTMTESTRMPKFPSLHKS